MEGRGSNGEGVVALGLHHCLCMVVWSPHHHLHMVVLDFHCHMCMVVLGSHLFSVELGLYNLSLEFSLAHVVVAESSFG